MNLKYHIYGIAVPQLTQQLCHVKYKLHENKTALSRSFYIFSCPYTGRNNKRNYFPF